MLNELVVNLAYLPLTIHWYVLSLVTDSSTVVRCGGYRVPSVQPRVKVPDCPHRICWQMAYAPPSPCGALGCAHPGDSSFGT